MYNSIQNLSLLRNRGRLLRLAHCPHGIIALPCGSARKIRPDPTAKLSFLHSAPLRWSCHRIGRHRL